MYMRGFDGQAARESDGMYMSPFGSPLNLLLLRSERQSQRMLIARAARTASTVREMIDCAIMSTFASARARAHRLAKRRTGVERQE